MAKDFKIGPSGPTRVAPKVSITPDMMKSFKTLTCDCGGQLFQPGVVLKKISALISPTGNEEIYPMEVLICTNCHKVPNETNTMKMLPEGVLAKKETQQIITKSEAPFPTNGLLKSPLSIVKDDEDDCLGGL